MQNAHMRVQKVQGVLRFDARFAGEGCGGALWAQYEVSVTGPAVVSSVLPRHFERKYKPV